MLFWKNDASLDTDLKRSRFLLHMHQSQNKMRDQRIIQYLSLVQPIAIHYAFRSGQDRDDLIQVGRLGLIQASIRFRESDADSFIGFAKSHIRGAILHYLRDRIGLVRLPRRIEERGLQLSREQNVSGAEDSHILQLYGNKATWLSLDDDLMSSSETMLDNVERLEHNQLIRTALMGLPDTERVAIQWVVIEGRSLRKTGAALGVSGMTIQRRVKRGLRQLAIDMDKSQPAA